MQGECKMSRLNAARVELINIRCRALQAEIEQLRGLVESYAGDADTLQAKISELGDKKEGLFDVELPAYVLDDIEKDVNVLGLVIVWNKAIEEWVLDLREEVFV